MKFMAKRRKGELTRRARKGFRGYPVATIAFYGTDQRAATKIAVGILLADDSDPVALERWYSDGKDLRKDPAVGEEIRAFIEKHEAKSVVMADGIMGCPHEEGVDYPVGEVCPQCPYWANRDRFTGELLTEN
ncbi:MAG: hypothetical protein GY842_05070 [bacterium]|nr:hypothetical protein [bacterium]